MALSDKHLTRVDFDFDSMLSEKFSQGNLSVPLDILASLDYNSFVFSSDESSESFPTSILKFEPKNPPSKMQNQTQDNSHSSIWWCNDDQNNFIYPGLDLEAAGFEFGNIGSLDSPLPEQDSWSTLSSPSSTTSQLPKPSTPKESSPTSFSYLGKPTTTTSSAKPKATKVEKLEKRREKNRTSQRRYRERKEKYIQDLENQLREVQRRYDLLQARLNPTVGQILPAKGVQPCVENEEWQWPEVGLEEDTGEDMEFN